LFFHCLKSADVAEQGRSSLMRIGLPGRVVGASSLLGKAILMPIRRLGGVFFIYSIVRVYLYLLLWVAGRKMTEEWLGCAAKNMRRIFFAALDCFARSFWALRPGRCSARSVSASLQPVY